MSQNQISRTNSYLTFRIDNEIYAANVSKILSILELTKITKLPRTPEYIRGVINLRGTVLPIVDLRTKFSLSPTEFTSNTCILVLEIIVESTEVKVGALVDSVLEVLEIKDEEIVAPPRIGNNLNTDFIEGMFKSDDTFTMILNLDLIFSADELTLMSSDLVKQKAEEIPEVQNEENK